MAFFSKKILQCYNGKELKGKLRVYTYIAGKQPTGDLFIRRLKYGISLINSAPRTPQTQSLIEQVNHVVEDNLAKLKAENNTAFWRLRLVEVVIQMNAQFHSTIQRSAREVLIRQKRPINWLSASKRRTAAGNMCEDGSLLSEANLSDELAELYSFDYNQVVDSLQLNHVSIMSRVSYQS